MIFCSRFPSDSCELQVAMKRFRRFRPFGTFQLRMDVSGSPSGPNKWLECFESWDILIRWVNPPLAHLARLQRSHFSWMILRRPCGFSVDFTFLSGFVGQTCSWGWYANHWITMHWSYWWIPAGAWTCKRCGRNLACDLGYGPSPRQCPWTHGLDQTLQASKLHWCRRREVSPFVPVFG